MGKGLMYCRSCKAELGPNDYVSGDYQKGLVNYLCESCQIEWTFIRTRKEGHIRGEQWELKTGKRVTSKTEEKKAA